MTSCLSLYYSIALPIFYWSSIFPFCLSFRTTVLSGCGWRLMSMSCCTFQQQLVTWSTVIVVCSCISLLVTIQIHVTTLCATFSITGPCQSAPNDLMWRNDRIVRVEPHFVPEPRDAVQQFESLCGHLTLFSPFGEGPLKDRADLISQREAERFAQYPEFGPIFHSLINGDCKLLNVVFCF